MRELWRTVLAVLLLMLPLSLGACSDSGGGAPPPPEPTITELEIPADFNFSSEQVVDFEVTVLLPDGSPHPRVAVNVYDQQFGPARRANLMRTFLTGNNGRVQGKLRLPGFFREVRVGLSAVGLANEVDIPIVNGKANHTFR